MPRVAVHHHLCEGCKIKTPCDGAWQRNHDGYPEVICRSYHLTGGRINPDFLCDSCVAKGKAE